MVERIIRFSVQKRELILFFMVLWVAGGLLALRNIRLGTVPDITNNQVQVITLAPQLSAQDMEQFITYPVELALGNLPGLIELRSVTRPGLSVVTVVFEDRMGTYLPRQLVQEQLTILRDELPTEWIERGPFPGPISTGLGEVYQYFLRVDSPFTSFYTLTDLRTIQDWIIRRQMMMLPGVVEVNSSGGYEKQLEILIHPLYLHRFQLDVMDVIRRLQESSVNSGGAYIEKFNHALFVRSEGIFRNAQDAMFSHVLHTPEGTVRIVDLASSVQWGTGIRYGALTANGEEATGGQVMMLKDANALEVVQQVRERIQQIQKSLPPGVHIQPYLDRKTLIDRTTETIRENLTMGALTVIFVLVILIGSLRSGLIVASVIPLSLLFAFVMMYFTGITANLMSLGAIDFGIVVDGAVIIVESILFALESRLRQIRSKVLKITPEERKTIAIERSSAMMRVALFGQLVVLLVFAPILTLSGVEGRMFKPMAYVFMFVLLGVIILCFTYVPAISSLWVRLPEEQQGFIDRVEGWISRMSRMIMKGIRRGYRPFRDLALRHRWITLGVALALLLSALYTFPRLGAVFMPRLMEGDIAFQMNFYPGTAMSAVIEASCKAQKLILDSIPEAEHAVCRIGVSEIPTDPMPMDLADCFVILRKDEGQWYPQERYEELVARIKHLLETHIPGITYSFTQPIELRFNELLTGIRYDIAVKVFGENHDTLIRLAEEIAERIQGVPGAADVVMEPVFRQPQLVVRFDRERLSRYQVSLERAAMVLQTALAGFQVTTLFSGERRYPVVVRYPLEYRDDLEDIRRLMVRTERGSLVPLEELADIQMEFQPVQISRENGYRRVYVGINVRGRDIESVVRDIQVRLQDLRLPPGYWIQYGGAFENLQKARARLSIVVPVVLLIIFILVYSALGNFRDTLLISMAIPFSIVGGVFILALRGMPFSISAGVGFVVLFGVSVLNGMILLARARQLARQGMAVRERIIQATEERLRPILLTALTTIVGFLPMAFSQSAGAEVQRPLATVVIGGLFTSTLLSLIVLPVLYTFFYRREKAILRKSHHS